MSTAAANQPAPEEGKDKQPQPPAAAPAQEMAKEAAAPPAKSVSRRSPSTLSRAQGEAIRKVMLICLAAQKWAQSLAGQGIVAAFVTALLADAKTIYDMDPETLNADSDGQAATRGGQTATDTLVASLRGLQSSGRQLHENTNPEKLKDYLIAEDITASRSVLDRSAKSLLKKSNGERPPGVNTEVLTRVQQELEAVTGQQQTQQNEKLGAKTLRGRRDTKVNSILRRAREIQFAADRAFPHPLQAHEAARVKFYLPRHRPFAPRRRKA